MNISPTQRPMPGSFATTALPPHLDVKAGPKSHIFQPPHTPGSASSSLYAIRVDSSGDRDRDHADDDNDRNRSTSRKRRRQDSPSRHHRHDLRSPQLQTPQSDTAATGVWSEESSIARSAGPSPPPYVNTRYVLAGGMAASASASACEKEAESKDVHFRRRWSVASRDEDDRLLDSAAVLPSSSSSSRNRKRRSRSRSSTNGRSESTTTDGWGTYVFSLVGGVAGKMWEFAKASAFGGFHAGGGKGYDIVGPGRVDATMTMEKSDASFETISTPLPGNFPASDPIDPDVTDDAGSSDNLNRPAKRIHTDTKNGWVMVPRSGHGRAQDPSRASSPRLSSRRNPFPPSPYGQSAPRPNTSRPIASRASIHHPHQRSRPHHQAPHPRRAPTTFTSSTGSPTSQSHRPPPPSLASRRSSPAKLAAVGIATTPSAPGHGSSPLSPEVRRYAAKLRREERETDASMSKFNRQLQDMIREGRAALGTKVEIEGDGSMMVDGEEEEDGMEDEEFC